MLPCVQRAKDTEGIRLVKRRICNPEVVGLIPGREDAVQQLWAC